MLQSIPGAWSSYGTERHDVFSQGRETTLPRPSMQKDDKSAVVGHKTNGGLKATSPHSNLQLDQAKIYEASASPLLQMTVLANDTLALFPLFTCSPKHEPFYSTLG